MLASEKTQQQKHQQSVDLEAARRNIASYRAAAPKQIADTYWYALCIDAPAARSFYRLRGDSIINRMAVCSLTAHVFTLFIDRDAVPPIVTRAALDQLHDNANALRNSIPTDVPLPAPVQTPEFNAGLHALCGWSPSPTVMTDKKGDAARRWVTRELAKGFLHAFDTVPHEYINMLLQILWPDANLRSTQRELQTETQVLLRAEVVSEKEKTKQEQHAKAAADHALQRAAIRTVTLTDAQNAHIDMLQNQIDRIKAGKQPFVSDTEQLRAMIAQASGFAEKALAEEIANQLSGIGREFGV